MKKFLTISIALFFVYSCATTNDVQKKNAGNAEKKVYVFDDVSVNADSANRSNLKTDSIATSLITLKPDTANLNKVMLRENVRYFVQVGAFTTKARAERFVKLNENKITFPMEISFNPKVKLFVVRLPFFRTRQEAEKVRNALWKTKEFGDAFIVTEIK